MEKTRAAQRLDVSIKSQRSVQNHPELDTTVVLWLLAGNPTSENAATDSSPL